MSDSTRRMSLLAAAAAAAAALATTPALPAPLLCAGDWKKVANDGPEPRTGTRLAYDSARRRLVLYGGADKNNVRLGDTWEWDGSAWTQMAADGPHGRTSHGMAFDTARGKVVMFGGIGTPLDPNRDNDDTWEWDGIAWQEATDADKRPKARNAMGMAYDTLRQKVVLFGGGVVFVSKRLGDTWAREDDWHRRPLAGGPGGRLIGGGMVFDREHGVTVQYGATESCNDASTWTWDGHSWTQSTGAQPGTRLWPAMAYDSARHRVVLYGGNDCHGSGPVDTWEWDGTDWQQVDTAGPGINMSSPTMAYDRDMGKVVLFGGNGPHDKATGETWTWSGPTYRCEVPIVGDINCDGVVDVDDGRIIVSGRGRPACTADDTRDLNGDGQINYDDKHLLDALCTFDGCLRRDKTADD